MRPNYIQPTDSADVHSAHQPHKCNEKAHCKEMVLALSGRNIQGIVSEGRRLVFRKSHTQKKPQPLRFCPFCGAEMTGDEFMTRCEKRRKEHEEWRKRFSQ